ncbi:MAG: LPS-assembly protein LptD [Campylobacterota bacterium]|nr:LPS-assembly protein LptD [Campylobacterota bacterium]
MRKLLFVFISVVWVLLPAEPIPADQNSAGNEKIEIMAEDLSSTETTVTAKGDVVVHYGDAVIHASTALYDKEKHLLTLKGKNVELMGYQGSKIHTKELKINTESKKVAFRNVFLSDSNDIWIYSDKAVKQDENLTFGASMMSSCDVNSSDWSLHFKDSHYDGEEHYMKMHGVKVHLWDVPVLYTPYLAFSTSSKRSSGLLFPAFGYRESEGLVYEQPIYWAPSLSWDVELNPQIRTKRGQGIYGTLRFADSHYSSGVIRAGYFKDNDNYTQENNVLNQTHYGFEMLYDSTKVLNRFLSKEIDIEDGLYINATLLNDIDYINLQKSQLTHFGVVPLQETRANYFIRNDDYYGGVYTKYFIDTRKESNDDTMQILPTVNLHKYLKPIFLDSLTYSLDLTMNNYSRKIGSTAQQAELTVPIEYTTSFFDDFLSLSLKEDLYYTKYFFGNQIYQEDEYQYYNYKHNIRLFSDLTKKYDTFAHTMQPSLTYHKPGDEQENILYQDLEDAQKELFAVGIQEENLALNFSQYFYDDKMKLRFFQRFKVAYLTQQADYNWGDLENEMQYNVGRWRFYNDVIYSYEFRKVKALSSRITLNDAKYNFSVAHTYKRDYLWDDDNLLDEKNVSNDINFIFGYQVTDRFKLLGGMIYNIDNSYSTQWKVGGRYDKDCWNLSAAVTQNIRPTLTTEGTDSITENSFTFQLNFVPFGGLGSSSF